MTHFSGSNSHSRARARLHAPAHDPPFTPKSASCPPSDLQVHATIGAQHDGLLAKSVMESVIFATREDQ
jgi:hypothetical protein